MTDIHGLDRFIGQHVDIDSGNGEGASGFIVDVVDEVEYRPEPSRAVTLDWGQGWLITADTVIKPVETHSPKPVESEAESPIEAMHKALHEEDGTTCLAPQFPHFCPHVKLAAAGLKAFRIWRMKQDDAYWKHHYVSKARSFGNDPDAVGHILREAKEEGAPLHILDILKLIGDGAAKAGNWQCEDPFAPNFSNWLLEMGKR